MKGSRAPCVVVVLCLASCGGERVAPPVASGRAAPASRSCKPEAPVELVLDARPLGGDRVALALRATPTADVDTLDLALVLPDDVTVVAGEARTGFGATAAGQTRTLIATVVHGRTAEIAGVARLPLDGVTMSRSASVRLGEPPPPVRTRRYQLPDGELAEEVRP